MNWFLENWQGLLGGGTFTTLLTYFANKKQNKADFLTKVENIYSGLVDELKADRELLRDENKSFKDVLSKLQDQFNSIQLAYAKEVEQSQNWEKLHRELAKEHEELKKLYSQLKSLYDKLKAEFEKHKKQTEI